MLAGSTFSELSARRVRRRRRDAVRRRAGLARAVHRDVAAGRSARPAVAGPVDGDWTLKVVDGAARDTGAIRAVSLHLTGFEGG
jgi:hypothetical protein